MSLTRDVQIFSSTVAPSGRLSSGRTAAGEVELHRVRILEDDGNGVCGRQGEGAAEGVLEGRVRARSANGSGDGRVTRAFPTALGVQERVLDHDEEAQGSTLVS